MKKPVIAIDGFSSTGKSSISKEIAKRLGLLHLDTGALYRGITYYGLKNCFDNGEINLSGLIAQLDEIQMEFKAQDNDLVLILNGEDITEAIRDPKVSEHVSFVAKQPEVREFLLHTQRDIASKGGVIMDGRDIGTVVLPDADYKFFLTASIDERTKRRHEELLSYKQQIDRETVKQNLIERDKMDSERDISPLKQAKDALLIDNTNFSKEETINYILGFIKI